MTTITKLEYKTPAQMAEPSANPAAGPTAAAATRLLRTDVMSR